MIRFCHFFFWRNLYIILKFISGYLKFYSIVKEIKNFCFLTVYRKMINFYILIFVLRCLLNSHKYSNVYIHSIYMIILSAERDSFCSFQSLYMFFSCPTLDRTSSTMLNRRSDTGWVFWLCFNWWIIYNISHLSVIVVCFFSQIYFIMLGKFPLILAWEFFLILRGYWILSGDFPAFIGVFIWFYSFTRLMWWIMLIDFFKI